MAVMGPIFGVGLGQGYIGGPWEDPRERFLNNNLNAQQTYMRDEMMRMQRDMAQRYAAHVAKVEPAPNKVLLLL